MTERKIHYERPVLMNLLGPEIWRATGANCKTGSSASLCAKGLYGPQCGMGQNATSKCDLGKSATGTIACDLGGKAGGVGCHSGGAAGGVDCLPGGSIRPS